MPWKLIVFLLIMTVFVVFAGFNLENKADISFGFGSIKEVPVFISIFFSFILGILVSSPFFITQKKKIKNKLNQQMEQTNDNQEEQQNSEK